MVLAIRGKKLEMVLLILSETVFVLSGARKKDPWGSWCSIKLPQAVSGHGKNYGFVFRKATDFQNKKEDPKRLLWHVERRLADNV